MHWHCELHNQPNSRSQFISCMAEGSANTWVVNKPVKKFLPPLNSFFQPKRLTYFLFLLLIWFWFMGNCSTCFLILYKFCFKTSGQKQHKNNACRVVALAAEVNEVLIRKKRGYTTLNHCKIVVKWKNCSHMRPLDANLKSLFFFL